jgi:pullulanase-type alpha-1,6-glucosidase
MVALQRQQRGFTRQLIWLLLAFFSSTQLLVAAESVTIAGSLQSELGCSDDWQPDCGSTHIAYDENDDVWQGIFTIPAGEYAYKAALDNSWDVNYGANAELGGGDINLVLAEETEVKFYFDENSGWITDNVNSRIVTVPGNFQAAVGCGEDWDPSCLRTWLQDADGDGVYTKTFTNIPAGTYAAKAAISESWDESYGTADGGDVNFTVPEGDSPVVFSFDSATNTFTVQTDAVPADPNRPKYAIIHYYREDGDYGDHTTGDFNDFWGLHVFGDAVAEGSATEWTAPLPFLGEDEYGRFAWIPLAPTGNTLGFIVHRGDTKDGTEADRMLNIAQTNEVWLKGGDGTDYATQADAQGFATIRYKRADGNYGEGTENYWGIHIWSDGGNNAIDPSAETSWDAPRAPDGFDSFGAYWNVPLNTADPLASQKPLKFIIHTPSGDDTEPGGTREPGGDQEFVPSQSATVWMIEQDETVHTSQGAAEDFAVIHYRRPEGDYGDYESDNFADFWGLHVWTGAAQETSWPEPLKPVSTNLFGVTFMIPLQPDASALNYIIHRGDDKDPGPDQSLNLFTVGYEAWQISGADPDSPYVLPNLFNAGPVVNPGNLAQHAAFWVNEHQILWESGQNPDLTYRLHFAAEGGLEATVDGVTGGEFIPLEVGTTTLEATASAKFPHLAGLPVLTVPEMFRDQIKGILKTQMAVSAVNADGQSFDATSLQIPGVLDDVYAGQAVNEALGLIWDGDTPTLKLWAPTARNVTLHVFADSNPDTESTTFEMTEDLNTGIWSVTGDATWNWQYYLYEVEVYVPAMGSVINNIVTDPYSVSLAMNSTRSQFVNLNDPSLKPAGWDGLAKPAQDAPEDISIYETHVRDFSIFDTTVPEDWRGGFMAFTAMDSAPMQHILALRDAGLTHVHLLPAFDIATINENKAERVEPDYDILNSLPPDSEQQQDAINAIADQDGFNWGYDPFHFNVPEGSYSTNPDGAQRILEFRSMVSALNQQGLRVVMDVVYNHTNASGQNDKSVFDKIVPGYYHRLDALGNVEKSTCCDNTASEHEMFEKFMIDSLIVWARDYKVDSFRFDLMGHHMLSNMEKSQNALHALTPENDGIQGSEIYIYGEGWNFGEVQNNARGVNATQRNVGGLGIGTFTDRMRDAVRGGGPFDDGLTLLTQGFGNGLHTNPNDLDQGDTMSTLLLASDQVRIGMAANLAGYTFVDRDGNTVRGDQVPYGLGDVSGYTLDPQEVINYVSKHDNQTLYDINVYGLPVTTPMEDRIRSQILSLSTVAYGQGVPFFHAGVDMLRSKSLDRDSFNSGDWFNHLDFTYMDNNYGVGLPVASKNQSNWDIMIPLLADPDIVAGTDAIMTTNAMFRELLQVRYSSPLFRLRTAEEIQNRLVYHNTGPDQIPGVIVMTLSDLVGEDLDPNYDGLAVVINSRNEAVTFTNPDLVGADFELHPVLQNSVDAMLATSSFDPATGSFTVPALGAAVFVQLPAPVDSTLSDLVASLMMTIDGYVAEGVLNPVFAAYMKNLLNAALNFAQIGQPQLAVLMASLVNFWASNSGMPQEAVTDVATQVQGIVTAILSGN